MNHMEVMKLIVKDSDLSKNEIRVLLAILSFSRKQKKQIKRRYLSELLQIQEQHISRTTSNLEKKGYLSRDYSEGVCTYELNPDRVPPVVRPKLDTGYQKEGTKLDTGTTHGTQAHYIENITVLSNRDIDSAVVKSPPPPYQDIIEDLNNRSKRKHQWWAEDTKKKIKARFNEGFTLEDFIYVNKVKTEEWLNNPKMDQYLRPKTLYGPNFKEYRAQRTKDEIQKSANEEKMNAPETQEALINLNLLQRGLNKQLN